MLNRGKTPDVSTRLPLPVTNIVSATGIVSLREPVTVTASNTGNFVLKNGPIASSAGDLVGRFGDTSLSFSAVLTTEVSYSQVLNRVTKGMTVDLNDPNVDLTSLLAAGEFYVVYETGRVYYKNGGSTTAIVATYTCRRAEKPIMQPSASTAITISDSTDLSGIVTKGIFVSVPSGASATIAFKLLNDSTANAITIQSSQFLPGSFARVMSTGTTLNASTIVGYGD